MASLGQSAFSNSGEFLAHCGQDGKLKIWETSTSRLKQEYTPNHHLASPCSVVGWLTAVGTSANTSVSPCASYIFIYDFLTSKIINLI